MVMSRYFFQSCSNIKPENSFGCGKEIEILSNSYFVVSYNVGYLEIDHKMFLIFSF